MTPPRTDTNRDLSKRGTPSSLQAFSPTIHSLYLIIREGEEGEEGEKEMRYVEGAKQKQRKREKGRREVRGNKEDY